LSCGCDRQQLDSGTMRLGSSCRSEYTGATSASTRSDSRLGLLSGYLSGRICRRVASLLIGWGDRSGCGSGGTCCFRSEGESLPAFALVMLGSSLGDQYIAASWASFSNGASSQRSLRSLSCASPYLCLSISLCLSFLTSQSFLA